MDFCLRAVYNCIYFYSCFEIFIERKVNEWVTIPTVKKALNNVREFVYQRFPLSPPIQQYLFVEDGNEILLFKGDEKLLYLLEPENYDFVIRNDYCKNKKWINNKIISKNICDSTYEVSIIYLLSFAITYKGMIIEIDLNTEKYNYMIVGNRIGKHYIYYLLKRMGFQMNDFDYTVQIITSNVDVLQMNSKQELVIHKNTISIE